ncbi:hypothetical protein PoB_000722900 [Plakobranchus ocellatus]|uniref:Uncharacterized protein n=1 Tax=Plakobranchus ocellatus TaxID=259542 RepID=A0AAV3YF89_9GAST|nr:hypothetical protein PoB_000722900 [Plakobranchus ocellatus]
MLLRTDPRSPLETAYLMVVIGINFFILKLQKRFPPGYILSKKDYKILHLKRKPVHNKVISGFKALRQAGAPTAGLEPATEGSLQISGRSHKPLCH